MENEMRNHSLRICLIIFLLICITANASTQIPVSVLKASKSITMNDAEAELTFLASDWTEGREVGTAGCDMAGDFLAVFYKLFQLTPAGDNGTYHKYIDFIEYTPDENMYLEVFTVKADPGTEVVRRYLYRIDFDMVNIFRKTENVTVTAPIVFAGYGLKIDEIGYDDYEGINVSLRIL